MFKTLKTLISGQSTRSEELLRDHYSIEIIDQKIREAVQNLQTAKASLATLIQQERRENLQIAQLQEKNDNLLSQAKAALENNREDLATDAAQAVANIENELSVRRETAERLERRIFQLRQSVDTAHRRITDLKQGALAAKAVRNEQKAQRGLTRGMTTQNPVDEANEMIAAVMNKADPFEQSEILQEIDSSLSGDTIMDRMAEAGFGKSAKTTSQDILNRIKS